MPSSLSSCSRSSRLPRSVPFLESLNEEQKAAVVCAEGPVVVLAGAGTGKTRVIASRIAYALATDVALRPAQVLALTFSRRAAEEMRGRVHRLRGANSDVGFFTFHGFCHRFLQDHLANIGGPRPFRLLDQTGAWVFFRTLLPELDLKLHGNLSDPTGCIDGFLRFIGRAKDELVSPRELLAYARKVRLPQERARLEEVGRVYAHYQQALRREGWMDFGDLIAETVRLLGKDPALRQRIRRRYRLILVDEFQDTNVAQIALLKLLSGPGTRLCVVGDDDQAIYRFRGASFASFLMMRDSYPKLTALRLTRNYRSGARILETAGSLIRHNEPDRYDPDKKLWTQRRDPCPVEVIVCGDEEQEARQALSLIQRYSDARLAVLYRAHAQREPLVRLLEREGIPFSIRGGFDLFDQPLIRDLLAFLQLIHDPSDSIACFRLLGHPALALPPQELLDLSRSAREKDQPLLRRIEEVQRPALFLSDWERARTIAAQDLEQGIRFLAERTFLREAMDAGLFQRFLRLLQRHGELFPGRKDLSSFLWTVDSVIRSGAKDGGEEEAVPSPDPRVQLMTVHQAKGLEFDVVILIGMVQGQFPSRGRKEPIPFPVDLMKERLPQGNYHLQEERRLCYVACTRARRALFLLTQDRTRRRPSQFIREMQSEAEISSGSAAIEKPVQQEAPPAVLARPTEAAPSLLPRKCRGAGAARLQWPVSDRFSFTQLETYRTCPMRYLYAYVYRLPARPSPQMLLGIDLHECMEFLYRRGWQPPSCEELLEFFRRLAPPRRYGEPHEHRAYVQLGLDLLARFYERQQGRWMAPLHVEKPFTLMLDEVGIQGVIDRVDSLPAGGVRIIDYKSGKPKEKAAAADQLQLWIYALAARDALQLDPRQVSFYYLRNNVELSFEVEAVRLEQARETALGIARRIRSGEFEPTPSARLCGRCDFRTVCPASAA